MALIGVAGSAVVALLNHHLQQRVQTQEAKIADRFALSMSDDLFAHFERVASESCGPYLVDPELRYGLGPEPNYLKMLGYIEFGAGRGAGDAAPPLRTCDAVAGHDGVQDAAVTPLEVSGRCGLGSGVPQTSAPAAEPGFEERWQTPRWHG